jgi:acyl carrier protein
MHGATNSKGDRTTFAVFRAMPVILAQIVKRPAANGTEFRGGVLVCQCRDMPRRPRMRVSGARTRARLMTFFAGGTPKYRSTFTGRRDSLMGDDTFNRIQSIIAGNLEIAPSKVMLPTSFIDDLQTDSLDMIELIIAFEDTFDVMIPDIAVETIVTVQDAVEYVKQLQKKKPRCPDVSGS